MPAVSVVVLCYRAGEDAVPFVRRIKEAIGAFSEDFEIVLVGNYHAGDQDPTPGVVRRLAAGDGRIKPVTLEKKGMMGWDARTGLAAAGGDIIVLIDGDSQMPAEDVLAVARLVRDKQCDLAMTFRENRRDGVMRALNSRIYNLLFRMLFPGYPVQDVNSKPKALSRRLYGKLKLTSDDWFLDAEIVIQARRFKAPFEQIPTVFLRNQSRKSFVRPGAVLEFLKNLAKARCREFFISK